MPASTSACVASSAMPAVLSDALGALVPNAPHVTALESMVPLTSVWRKLLSASVPSSTLMTACYSSANVDASSDRVIVVAAPFQT